MTATAIGAMSGEKRSVAAVPASDLPSRLDISVSDRPAGVEAMWRQLESVADATVYQRYDWVDASVATLDRGERRSAFIVTATLNGEPAFLLPLCIGGSIVRTLRWAGGNHANYSCGLFSPEFLNLLQPGDVSRIMDRIRTLVPGIGVIHMCCQPVDWNGMRNPMLELRRQPAVNRAFVMDLRGGFDAFLKKRNARRKRKKFRLQEKMANAAGGYRLVMPADETEAVAILGAFLKQKSVRLRSQGLRDVFSSGHAREFLCELIRRSSGLDEPLLRLFALEIGGNIRAVLGGGVHRNRLSGYFSSIALDELTESVPAKCCSTSSCANAPEKA